MEGRDKNGEFQFHPKRNLWVPCLVGATICIFMSTLAFYIPIFTFIIHLFFSIFFLLISSMIFSLYFFFYSLCYHSGYIQGMWSLFQRLYCFVWIIFFYKSTNKHLINIYHFFSIYFFLSYYIISMTSIILFLCAWVFTNKCVCIIHHFPYIIL